MKNWEINYYTTLKKFAEKKLKELKESGREPDANPLVVFFSNNGLLPRNLFDLDKEELNRLPIGESNELLSFSDLLSMFSLEEAARIFDERITVIRSYRYQARQPRSSQVKKFIMKSNGVLCHESFFGEVTDKKFIPK